MPTTPKGIPTPSDAVKISQLAEAMRAMGVKVDELLPAGLSGNALSAGPIPAGTDLNEWIGNTYAGFWEVNSTTIAAGIKNLPGSWRGALLNMPGIGAQLYAPYTQPATLYYRAVISIESKLWNVWRRLLTDDDLRKIDQSIISTVDAADAANRKYTAEADAAGLKSAKTYADEKTQEIRDHFNTSHIALDTDGVPFYSPGSMSVQIHQDADGVPYFTESGAF